MKIKGALTLPAAPFQPSRPNYHTMLRWCQLAPIAEPNDPDRELATRCPQTLHSIRSERRPVETAIVASLALFCLDALGIGPFGQNRVNDAEFLGLLSGHEVVAIECSLNRFN